MLLFSATAVTLSMASVMMNMLVLRLSVQRIKDAILVKVGFCCCCRKSFSSYFLDKKLYTRGCSVNFEPGCTEDGVGHLLSKYTLMHKYIKSSCWM